MLIWGLSIHVKPGLCQPNTITTGAPSPLRSGPTLDRKFSSSTLRFFRSNGSEASKDYRLLTYRRHAWRLRRIGDRSSTVHLMSVLPCVTHGHAVHHEKFVWQMHSIHRWHCALAYFLSVPSSAHAWFPVIHVLINFYFILQSKYAILGVLENSR